MRFLTSYLLFLLLFPLGMAAQPAVEYLPEDSVKVEQLLQRVRTERGDENRVVWFGKQFLGLPYVAHTLEKGNEEHLIVNLRELDCTTYLGTVCALALCDEHNKRTFADFCHYLQQLRYYGGKIDGYTSRKHYFTQSSSDNIANGWLVSVLENSNYAPLSTQNVRINYMSRHPNSYKQLRLHPQFVKTIAAQERATSGKQFKYLHKSQLGKSQKQLNFIHNGDLVAIVTSKDGLDISHVGIALWQNGTLRFMHASSTHKKVVIEPKPFYNYMQGITTNQGIRLFRLK